MKQKLLWVVFRYSIVSGIAGTLFFSCNHPASDRYSQRDSALVARAIAVFTLKVDSGLFGQVKPYLDSVYRVNNITSPRALAYKYEKLAGFYYFQNQDTFTTHSYLDSIQLLIEKGHTLDADMMMSWYFYTGHLATEAKRFDEAFRSYYRGKLIVDAVENGCGNVRYYHTLAMILFRQHKYQESKEYFRKCYAYAALCNGDDTVLVIETQRNALSNVGICCENLQEYDSAAYYYNRCLELTEATKALFVNKRLALQTFNGVVYGNLGGALAKQKRYAEAEQALKKGIALNYTPEGEIGDAVLSKIKLADLYLLTGRIAACRDLVQSIQEDLGRISYLLAEVRFYDIKYRYYAEVKDFNRAFESLLRHQKLKKDLEASTSYNILTSADHIKEFEALESRLELEMLKSNNEIKNRYLVLSVATVAMAIVIVVLLLVRRKASTVYIDELTRLNTRVQQSNDKLKHSLHSLQLSQDENTKIMKIVAHDLRSPIAGIMSLVRLIKVDDLTREELNEYIDLVEKSGTNALAFIEDLLYINKTNQSLDTKDVDVQQLLESCVSIMQAQAARKNQVIHLQTGPGIIKVNEEKMWRVINNIISNAIKFSAIGTNIYVAASVKKDSVLISVKDEGMGIPDALKDKMFSMFSGAGRTGTGGEQSYGLGLSIARQIIDAHKGNIWFESEVGKGTTFFVEIPR